MSLHIRYKYLLRIFFSKLKHSNVIGAVGIATGLVNNDTLRVIRLHSNPLGAKGASIILQAISTNTNSAIIELGLKVRRDLKI